MNKKLYWHVAMPALLLGAVAPMAAAQAETVTFDVTGIESFDSLGTTGNGVYHLDLGAGATITGVAWDVTLTAYSPSWLSELLAELGNTGVEVADPAYDWYRLRPGFGNNVSGTASYSGSVDLTGEDQFSLLDDGLLRIEFAEWFDDFSGAPDGIWDSGTLTVTYTPTTGGVPEPATWAMMIAGFGLVGSAMRRRGAQVAFA